MCIRNKHKDKATTAAAAAAAQHQLFNGKQCQQQQ